MMKSAEKFVFVYPVGIEGEASKINFLNEVKQASPAFEEKQIICLPCDGKEKTIIQNLNTTKKLHNQSNVLHLILSNEMPQEPLGVYTTNFYKVVDIEFKRTAFLYAYEYTSMNTDQIRDYLKTDVEEYYPTLKQMAETLFTA